MKRIDGGFCFRRAHFVLYRINANILAFTTELSNFNIEYMNCRWHKILNYNPRARIASDKKPFDYHIIEHKTNELRAKTSPRKVTVAVVQRIRCAGADMQREINSIKWPFYLNFSRRTVLHVIFWLCVCVCAKITHRSLCYFVKIVFDTVAGQWTNAI